MKVLSVSEEKLFYVDIHEGGDVYNQYRTYAKIIDGRVWEVLNGDNWEVVDDSEELDNALLDYKKEKIHEWFSNKRSEVKND
jgi:hypothetical protein